MTSSKKKKGNATSPESRINTVHGKSQKTNHINEKEEDDNIVRIGG